MATYVISDIHGNLDVFKKLLEKIDFKYDGTDSLYLLGDYVDWGPKSIETIQYVMDLTSKYNFIKAIIGNHDLMFLEQIESFNKDKRSEDYNWLYNNRGYMTWEQYLELEEEDKKKIENFLKNLDYRIDTQVGNKTYLMAHACPAIEFKYNEELSEEDNLWEYEHLRHKAVWERIIRKCLNVIEWYNRGEEKKYDMFICGHTINDDLRINIRESKGYIDIDCGAKILGYKEFEDDYGTPSLAALRLDDYKEFYQYLEE